MEDERVLPKSIIPEEVQPFYDSFFEEAEKRGVFLDKSPIEITIIDNLNAGGRTHRNKKLIELPSYLFDWGNEENRINTEYNIFHELFHYYLGLDHNDELILEPVVGQDMKVIIPIGSPKSMMHYNKRAYTVGKEHLRSYYLDQEFKILY